MIQLRILDEVILDYPGGPDRSSTSVLISERWGWGWGWSDYTHRKVGGNLTTQAEIGVMRPRAQEHQQPPKLEEARMGSSLEHPKGISPAEKL